jgi:hypothetical protein
MLPRAELASLEASIPPQVRFASLEVSSPPSGEVRLARGFNTPSGKVLLARGHLHARRPRSCPCVRAFNAQTQQDARHDPNTPGNHVPTLFHQLPGEGHPHHCIALCDEAGVNPVTLCRLPPYG